VNMRRGALLHDMGKLGIPDNIFLKPGKLSDEVRYDGCQDRKMKNLSLVKPS
jgi:hypothetical protein